jgi:hypothetical protein
VSWSSASNVKTQETPEKTKWKPDIPEPATKAYIRMDYPLD